MTIDLDALEKLADRCSFGDPWYTEENLLGRQNFGQFLPQDRAFIAGLSPATAKALIAELKEARAVIDRLASSEAFDMPQAISGPLAAEMRARMDYARAFLARNGKGEG